ncbi:MAG: hypothetical protein GY928_33965 [Colwellia sp.]|nr:hypothetical protein [Colwellia sp.]
MTKFNYITCKGIWQNKIEGIEWTTSGLPHSETDFVNIDINQSPLITISEFLNIMGDRHWQMVHFEQDNNDSTNIIFMREKSAGELLRS